MKFNLKEHIKNIENDIDGVWKNISSSSFFKFIKPQYSGTRGTLQFSTSSNFNDNDCYSFLVKYDFDTKITSIELFLSEKLTDQLFQLNLYYDGIRYLDLIKNSISEKYFSEKPR